MLRFSIPMILRARGSRFILFLILVCPNRMALAQSDIPLQFGFNIGIPFNPPLQKHYDQYVGLQGIQSSSQKTPPVSLGLALGYAFAVAPFLSVRFEPTRKRVRFDEATRVVVTTDIVDTSRTTVTGTWWEYPLTGKIQIPKGRLRPYASVGVSFYETNLTYSAQFNRTNAANAALNTSGSGTGKVVLNTPQHSGIVVGGGVEFAYHHVLLGPGLRFTHWTRPFQFGWDPTPNQGEMFVGLTFRP